MTPFQKNHKLSIAAYQKSISDLIENGQFILGPAVENFEKLFARYTRSAEAIGVANGLDALKIILRASKNLELFKPGKKILVPANTYIATILAIIEEGYQPTLVDPDPKTFNISLSGLKRHICDETIAILNVHLYGFMSTGKELADFARERGILVFEDASQAHGAVFEDSIAGSQGLAAGFSLYPTKNLGALGDGGIITTADKDFANECRVLRNYGKQSGSEFIRIGINSRLDELQAYFLIERLQKLDEENNHRRVIATCYDREIVNNHILQKPMIRNGHVYHQYTILVDDRSKFIDYCQKHGVECGIHYEIPPYRQLAMKTQVFYNSNNFPVSDVIHHHTVSLAFHPSISFNEIAKYGSDKQI